MNDSPPAEGAVAAAFGLTGSVGSFEAVAGAWSNRVYRLAVGSHRYAVKEMRDPWSNPRWREWLAQAWAFEQRAIDAGVAAPRPVPNPVDGGCLASVERAGGGSCDVRVHHWVNGATAAPLGPASPALAAWAGQTLAIMHTLEVRPIDRSAFPTLSFDNVSRWPVPAEEAARAGAPWADDVAAAMDTVAAIGSLAAEAGEDRDAEVMTHGDVDQKNMLVVDGVSFLCDWDVAAPIPPQRELADVALSLATWERFDIAAAVIKAYRSAGGHVRPLAPHDLAQSMVVGIDWIVLNIERALRTRRTTEEEAALGTSLVPGLLRNLRRSLDTARRIAIDDLVPVR